MKSRLFTNLRRVRAIHAQRGINYVEVMVATMLLTIALVPALDSLRNAIASPTVPAGATRSLILCVKSHLDFVSADPYSALLKAAAAAGDVNTASSYSVAATTSCPALQVYLAYYDGDNTSSPFAINDTGLLFLRVAAPANSASLSTLVTRQ